VYHRDPLRERHRASRQNFKGPRQSLAFLPQYDLVAATKNFDLCALQAKFLWQPYGLTVAGTKNSGDCHVSAFFQIYTLAYIRSQRPNASTGAPA